MFMKYSKLKLMNNVTKYLLFLFPLLLVQKVNGQQSDPSKMKDISGFKAKLEEMAESTNSIEASFHQEKYMSILSNNIDSEGKIFFKKPNLLKWSYDQPYEYTIVLDGKEIKIKDEEKVNAFDIESSKIFKQVNDLILSSVNGQILDESKFDIEYYDDQTNYVTYLNPKDPNMGKYISKIEVFFNKQDLTVDKIILYESNNDYTKITFSNKTLNGSIPDQEFIIN